MKKLILAAGLMALAGGALAAGKPCEELKAELAAKLDAKGVQGYTLEIVKKGEPVEPARAISSSCGCQGWPV
mgnify:CR=1 FL=1